MDPAMDENAFLESGMHRRRKRVVLVGIVVWLTVAAGIAAQQKTVSASQAWVKVPAADQSLTEGFVVVENPTMYDVYLIGAVTEAAGKVEFRDVSRPGGASAQVVTEVTVPAYGSISMNPKGLHMVLSGLKRPLKAGDTIPLTLRDHEGSTMEVSAAVRKE
jgi:copper(I)-binding protein